MLPFSPSDWVLDQEASHCVLRIFLIRCMLAIRVTSTLVMLSPTTSFIILYYAVKILFEINLCAFLWLIWPTRTQRICCSLLLASKYACWMPARLHLLNLALPGAPGLKDGVGSKEPRVGAGYLDFITWEGCAWVGARWSLEPCAGGKGAKQREGLLQGVLSLKNWSLGHLGTVCHTNLYNYTLVTPCLYCSLCVNDLKP